MRNKQKHCNFIIISRDIPQWNFNGKLKCLIRKKKDKTTEEKKRNQKSQSMFICCVFDTDKSCTKTINVDGLAFYRHHLGTSSSFSSSIVARFGTGIWLASPEWHIWWTMTLITLLWRSLIHIDPSDGLTQKAPDRISYLVRLANGIIMAHNLLN